MKVVVRGIEQNNRASAELICRVLDDGAEGGVGSLLRGYVGGQKQAQ
jgi:hypothetical protein